MRIKKKHSASSEISTASMPDIVFLLLFFFMVTATIKTESDDLQIQQPQAHAVTQVKKKFLIRELHVGFPKNAQLGTAARISDGDVLLSVDQLGNWVEQQKTDLGEAYQDQMIVLIKAHKTVDMGLISDIQEQLRKHNARKVLFRTLESEHNFATFIEV